MFNGLPTQKLPISKKGEEWRHQNLDYFYSLSFINSTGRRTTNWRKAVAYDLYNGIFDPRDLEYVCNPIGVSNEGSEFPARMQHYDITSPQINALLGEEDVRPDNTIVVAESNEDINRKKSQISQKLLSNLQQHLQSKINPTSIDPNNPPPPPEELVKYQNSNISDIIEIKSNKLLHILKRKNNTKLLFARGYKDALIAAEEIYWVGLVNSSPVVRRANPLNISIILDQDSDFIDDAIAVVETRLLTPQSTLDEFGDDLTSDQITKIEKLSSSLGANNRGLPNSFQIDSNGTDLGLNSGAKNSSIRNDTNIGLIRVVRVEWQSFKKVGNLTTINPETGEKVEEIVDEFYKLSTEDEEKGDTIEWFWINEAWEGTKLGDDIYIAIRPKVNQRRRLDNPYYCKLGYSGFIYNATNSVSVSMIDRMKPYQYLYNILMYRLELAFASDMGKVLLMDLSQIPRSEGIDVEKWLYYLKAMKIAFVNNFEEGKGKFTGQRSTFNQFQSLDLSLANVINQYVEALNFIKQQMFYISGVDLTRLGQTAPDAGLGVSQTNLQQSANVTRPWVTFHNLVKEKVYTALIECAKVAYKNGYKDTIIYDDLTTELFELDEFELENSEFGVYCSNSTRDLQILETIKQKFDIALQYDKVNLSEVAKVLNNDSIKDITRILEQGEQSKIERDQKSQEAQQQSVEKINNDRLALEHEKMDRDDNNKQLDRENKIQIEEIKALGLVEGMSKSPDLDKNGIPDVIEIGKLNLETSKHNYEEIHKAHERKTKDKELELKDKELKIKKQDTQIRAIAEKKKIDTQKAIEKMKAENALRIAKLKPKQPKK